MSVSYKIISNVRDTMSDRAPTETHFNQLLEQYRSEVLPYVCLGWVDLSNFKREFYSMAGICHLKFFSAFFVNIRDCTVRNTFTNEIA